MSKYFYLIRGKYTNGEVFRYPEEFIKQMDAEREADRVRSKENVFTDSVYIEKMEMKPPWEI
jgi:hypothetical protein